MTTAWQIPWPGTPVMQLVTDTGHAGIWTGIMYEDIYALHFDTNPLATLWEALKHVVCFWIEQGVRFFRVAAPHTQPLPFWAWLINEIKAAHPAVLFLAEAFTQPTVQYHLAKRGFTPSYSYFAWQHTKSVLTTGVA